MLATYVSDLGSTGRPRTSWFHGLSAGKKGHGPIVGPLDCEVAVSGGLAAGVSVVTGFLAVVLVAVAGRRAAAVVVVAGWLVVVAASTGSPVNAVVGASVVVVTALLSVELVV